MAQNSSTNVFLEVCKHCKKSKIRGFKTCNILIQTCCNVAVFTKKAISNILVNKNITILHCLLVDFLYFSLLAILIHKVIMDTEELLIDCVREHTVLYDPREKKYMDLNHKADIWRRIASQCGLSSDIVVVGTEGDGEGDSENTSHECNKKVPTPPDCSFYSEEAGPSNSETPKTRDSAKELWKKLRDAYRSCKKRKRGRSATSNTSLWKYEEQMSFLHPYMKDRPRRINSSIAEDNRMAVETQSDEGHCSEPFPVILSDTSQASPAIQNDSSILPTFAPSISEVSNIYNTHTSTKPHKAVMDFLQGETKKRGKVRQQYLEQEDPLKLFFNSMYATTKTLPMHLQRKVKKELFGVVTEAEEEAETYFRTFPSHPPSVETASLSSSTHD